MREAFTAFGLVLEVVGAAMMASAYLGATPSGQKLRVLWSALWRGRLADGAARVAGLNREEDAISALRGLVLIGCGFAMQLLVVLTVLLSKD